MNKDCKQCGHLLVRHKADEDTCLDCRALSMVDDKVEKAIKWVAMPCMKCNKIMKMPEHAIYCRECNSFPQDA